MLEACDDRSYSPPASGDTARSRERHRCVQPSLHRRGIAARCLGNVIGKAGVVRHRVVVRRVRAWQSDGPAGCLVAVPTFEMLKKKKKKNGNEIQRTHLHRQLRSTSSPKLLRS